MRVCRNCDKEYEKNNEGGRTFYCSVICYNDFVRKEWMEKYSESTKKKRNVIKVLKKCICGKEICVVDTYKYCSRRCLALSYKKAKVESICTMCGEKYMGNKKTKHCSVECRKKKKDMYITLYNKRLAIERKKNIV